MSAAADPSSPSPPGMVRAVLDDRLLTLPNLISASRLVALPVFVWLVLHRDAPAAGAVLLGVMGATDWVDGQVARRTGQVSELGKILDPAADRIVLITAVVTIVVAGAVPWWITVPVLVREPLMFVAVPVLAALGATRIDVTFVGKAGTFALMTSFPLLLYGSSDAPGAIPLGWLGYAAAVPGLALSWYAAWLYVPLARQALREGRTGPADAPGAGSPTP